MLLRDQQVAFAAPALRSSSSSSSSQLVLYALAAAW
jgi:hypothetical protein